MSHLMAIRIRKETDTFDGELAALVQARAKARDVLAEVLVQIDAASRRIDILLDRRGCLP